MPIPPESAPGRTPRRAFLRLAALVPLAPLAAGCATVKVGPKGEPAAGPSAPASAGAADALEAVRAFPLPSDAEPAAVFRAAVARGRGA